MKKLTITLTLALVALSGCYTNYRPNTQKGWHMDEINKHTKQIDRLNPVIYETNKKVMPQRMDQLEDTLSWQERMQGRMQGMKGGQ